MAIGDKIGEVRRIFNMSQADLADILEVSRQSVSKWELNVNEPDSKKLVHMASIFDVGVEYFYTDLVYEFNYKKRKQDTLLTLKNGAFFLGLIVVAVAFIASIIFPYEKILYGHKYHGFIAYLISDETFFIKAMVFLGLGSILLSFLVPLEPSNTKKEKKGKK